MKRSIGLLLLLAGCQFIPGTKEHEIRRAEEAVRYVLDDPAAANFRNDRIVGSGDTEIICGEVNAKNRMGAYVGFRPYAYVLRTKEATILPQDNGSTVYQLAVINFPSRCEGA